MMFYGPGGGEHEDWQSFQMVVNVDDALAVGVPESTLRENLLFQIGSHGRFNFNGLSKAYAQRQVKRRVKAYTAIATLHYGIPFVTRRIAYARYATAYRPLDIAAGASTRKYAKREVAEFTVYRVLARRAPTRVIARFIPYVGWGLAGYDIWTITTQGKLWGVQIYEKNE